MIERIANPHRGEVALRLGEDDFILRPSFEAIIAIEKKVGSIVSLAIGASEGDLGMQEICVIFQECLVDGKNSKRKPLSEQQVGEYILKMGLANILPILRDLLTHILGGDEVNITGSGTAHERQD